MSTVKPAPSRRRTSGRRDYFVRSGVLNRGKALIEVYGDFVATRHDEAEGRMKKLTRAEAARAAGVSLRTFDRMLRDGRFAPMPLETTGRAYSFRAADVRRWLDAGRPNRAAWLFRTRRGNAK